jgi:hypothetical protein
LSLTLPQSVLVGVGGHCELWGGEGTGVAHWKGLAVIVSWEGERDWGATLEGVGRPHELERDRGDWDGPVSSLILPKGALGGVGNRVDNGNHFASFFTKNWLQTIIVFREKITRLSR